RFHAAGVVTDWQRREQWQKRPLRRGHGPIPIEKTAKEFAAFGLWGVYNSRCCEWVACIGPHYGRWHVDCTGGVFPFCLSDTLVTNEVFMSAVLMFRNRSPELG